MKKIFGTQKTVLSGNKTITEQLNTLSEDALQVLDYIATRLESGNYDPRGVPVEYDKTQLSVFTPATINEIKSSGLISEHPDSSQGISFIFMNKDVIESLSETGNHNPV